MRRRVSQKKVRSRIVRTKRRVSNNRTKRRSKVRNTRNTRNTKKYRQRGAGPTARGKKGRHPQTNRLRKVEKQQRDQHYRNAMNAASAKDESNFTLTPETQGLLKDQSQIAQTQQIGTDSKEGFFSRCFGRPPKEE